MTKIFDDRIKKKSFKGIDKIRPTQFEKNKEVEIKRIADRYKNKEYKFIPYLEILRNKGRNKAPRMISSPTVRDKITLTALKEYLHRQFPESVPNKLANCVVRELKQKIDSDNYNFYYRTDIKSFYDEINRTRLLDFLAKKVTNSKTIKVLTDSIENVTIPHNESKRNSNNYVTAKGIPQGLPISNILAQIYLKKIDNHFSQNNICYFRFVDDIIILTN
ncbi:RNA-directed DNA polymerase, partial [Saccharicrinis fermentans]